MNTQEKVVTKIRPFKEMNTIEAEPIKIAIPIKIGKLPPIEEPPPGEKIQPIWIRIGYNGFWLKAKFNGKKYRKVLKTKDVTTEAFITGNLFKNEILEAGIRIRNL